jgi:hypothetical protein
MCPVCAANAVMAIASVGSTGGVVAMVARTFRTRGWAKTLGGARENGVLAPKRDSSAASPGGMLRVHEGQ